MNTKLGTASSIYNALDGVVDHIGAISHMPSFQSSLGMRCDQEFAELLSELSGYPIPKETKHKDATDYAGVAVPFQLVTDHDLES